MLGALRVYTEGIGSPGSCTAGGFEPPNECWESNPAFQQEQVLLTTELFHQSQLKILNMICNVKGLSYHSFQLK